MRISSIVGILILIQPMSMKSRAKRFI